MFLPIQLPVYYTTDMLEHLISAGYAAYPEPPCAKPGWIYHPNYAHPDDKQDRKKPASATESSGLTYRHGTIGHNTTVIARAKPPNWSCLI